MWTTKWMQVFVEMNQRKVFGEKWVKIWITSLSVFVWSGVSLHNCLLTDVQQFCMLSGQCWNSILELTISDHTDSGSAPLLNAQALRPGNSACRKMFQLQIQMKHLNQHQWEFMSCFWTVVGRKREALTTRELSSSHTNSSTWHLINSQTHLTAFIYSLILSESSDVWNTN